MKLATLDDGSRDGQLVVVSRDLSTAHHAHGIASKLQQLLDDWSFLSPQLEDLYATLNGGKARHAFAFDPRLCAAPLPRASQWIELPAYRSHAVRRAGDVPANGPVLPIQVAADALRGPREDIPLDRVEDELDVEPGWAVLTGDVEPGTPASAALDRVRLLMLCAAWRLRAHEPAERAAGSGPVHSRPATSCAPVVVTPDELCDGWRAGRLHLRLEVSVRGRRLGEVALGEELDLHAGQWVAHAARHRPLGRGCVVGSGPVSPRDVNEGVACLAERRALDQAAAGDAPAAPVTPYLQPGDPVRIDATGADGQSVFGSIDVTIATRTEAA